MNTNKINLNFSLLYYLFFAALILVQPITAAKGTENNLVNVKWLEKNLINPEVLILDASPNQIYILKHIPGAVSVDLLSWYGLNEKPVTEMEKLFQAWGISNEKKIIVYDQGGTMLATRLFYSLYYYGFPLKNLFILDGGLFKWQETGYTVVKDIEPAQQGTFKIKNIKEDIRVKLPEFINASGDPANNVLLDALGADWHFGEVLAFNRAGHIPNAVLVPSTDFYNPDKTFKSAEEIEIMMDYFDIKPTQKIYTHCGGGVAASVPFFALKFILNYPKVALYWESEMGWLSDERELPYWTYDAPFLMRGTNWLHFWGGDKIRMFGGADLSIVDVRSAEAFNKGHVPFSVNIPSDKFKSNIATLNNLEEILKFSGITESDEAVIISGSGITKEAALAFVVLEKMAQKKVSLFIDSLDKWTQSGFSLTKEATVIRHSKNRSGLSITSAAYPHNYRNGVLITNAESTPGFYTRILIASGKNVPAKNFSSKVVHIPYSELLNGENKPKPAKDIWKILDQAGIPRYAELVCISDDPGEAAINYFILKLMGYPDIKVMML